MSPLDTVNLAALMGRTSGKRQLTIGLIDGPVLYEHPDLASAHLIPYEGGVSASCRQTSSVACLHGTFVAGVLCARRGSPAPAICPDCTLVVRPIFAEHLLREEQIPSASPHALAIAILDCLARGARLINLSAALATPSMEGEFVLEEALNQAARVGALVVAAAGNQGTLGSSIITRHTGVIPVVACDLNGNPDNASNLGSSVGKRGLRAPGVSVTSLGTAGHPLVMGGTSVAVPFVTGTIALLWSEFPHATGTDIKLAVTQASTRRRASVVPPLLDAESAYQALRTMKFRS